MSKPKIIVIAGPTASGKSALAVKVAKKIGGEIVSADSRQVYKGLNIGSGKINQKEMAGIPHHLLDVVSPNRRFTAAEFVQQAQKSIKQIETKGKIPIIVGGTGFYIDSLLGDFSLPLVPPNKKLRAKLKKLSTPKLFAKLKTLDPRRAKNIDEHNPRRLVRAIEIATALGQVPPLKKQNKYEALWLGLNLPPTKLKKNIHERLIKRLKQGLVAEVKKLKRGGLSWQRLYDLGLEYRSVSLYLRGKLTKKEMLAGLEKEISTYAGRQKTWWQKNKKIIWLDQPRAAVTAVENFLNKSQRKIKKASQ